MAKYAMVIDLHKCVGCGACGLACKTENNTDIGINWAHHIKRTSGTFPDVKYEYIPTLCNHCENAPCAKTCPTGAMHKDELRLTLHDASKCIGCKSCMQACPYNVIHYNKKEPHERFRDAVPFAPGTATGKETAEKSGEKIPNYNPERAKTYLGIREKGIVEKCTLCDHRIKNKELPWCVASCPAKARTVGDLDDPKSEVSKLLGQYGSTVLKPDRGTSPKVFYIRQYT